MRQCSACSEIGVDICDTLHRAPYQPLQKLVALRPHLALFGIHDFLVAGDVCLIGCSLTSQRKRICNARCRKRLWEDTGLNFPQPPHYIGHFHGLIAASKPLLPLLAPARSIACSSVFVVRTPNATGHAKIARHIHQTLRGRSGDVVEVRRLPADQRA